MFNELYISQKFTVSEGIVTLRCLLSEAFHCQDTHLQLYKDVALRIIYLLFVFILTALQSFVHCNNRLEKLYIY